MKKTINATDVTIKNSGATFTPTELADYLSDKILNYINAPTHKYTILDSAYGNAALLTSIANKINNTFEFELQGYETNVDYLLDAKNNLSSHLSDNQ